MLDLIAHVIEGLGISLWEEPIVIGLMWSIFELLRQLRYILLIICLYAIHNDLHRSSMYVCKSFHQEIGEEMIFPDTHYKHTSEWYCNMPQYQQLNTLTIELA